MAILRREGNLTFLRAHRLKTGFGPSNDFIESEVVARISSEPAHAFGFTLRRDDLLPAHQAMFDLLRDAFAGDLPVAVEYELAEGRVHGELFRVELTRSEGSEDPRFRLVNRLLDVRRD